MRNRRERKQAKLAVEKAANTVGSPVNNVSAAKITQEPEGSEIYSSSAVKWQWPKIDTALIEQYADNALLAEPLKNCAELIFTSYSDHGTPWVTIKDPEGEIDEQLSKEGQIIAKTCDFYSAHIKAFYDQELGGCSIWSPGWGEIEGVTGVCPVVLRNLPWNSFRELPNGFMDVYNDIMQGVVVDQSTGEPRIFQKVNDRAMATEIIQTSPLPAWIIVRDPITPKPAGSPGCLPVITLITNYNYADKCWNIKMNRIAAPILMLQIQTALTAKIEEYAKNVVQKWGRDTGFLLTKDMLPVDPHLVESQTAEERLAWLQKRINGYYNPASFLQKEGNSIGGADTGAERLINNRTVSVLSRLENGLGEVLLNIWLNVNGFVGYSAEVRFPRPETKNDQQTLAEITEANKNGQISRTEARQLYPNLDLPELTPEEEAKMDAEYEKRKPAQNNPFGMAGTGYSTGAEIPIGNIQSPVQRTEALSQVEAELLAATRQCATDVKRIVREQVQSINPQSPVEVSLLQRVKNVFMPVNNADEEGTWVTISGNHILIKDGESIGDAFKRTTGKDLAPKSYATPDNPDSEGYMQLGKEKVWVPGNETGAQTIKRITGEDMLPGENMGQAMTRITGGNKTKLPASPPASISSPDSNYQKDITKSGSEIASTIQKGEYKHYGIRYLSENPNTGEIPDLKVGDSPPNSYKWNDDIPTNKPLSGASAVKITENTVKNPLWHLNVYGYKGKVVLLGSNSAIKGADGGEIVMKNAKVLDTFERGGK